MICIKVEIPEEICEIDDELKAIYHSRDTVFIWTFKTRTERNRFMDETIGMMKEERDLGAIIIDIGASLTSIGIYLKDSLIYSSFIKIGGIHITSDLVKGLGTESEEAEKLKILHGSTEVNQLDNFSNKDIRSDADSLNVEKQSIILENINNFKLTDLNTSNIPKELGPKKNDDLNIENGNPYLKPSTSHNLEIGYKNFSGKYKGSYYLFAKHSTNLIEPIVTINGDTAITNYQNLSENNSFGINYYGSISFKNLDGIE